MAYQEFYCNQLSPTANLHAGSTPGVPIRVYDNGSWVQGTRVFTVASGNPITDGVPVGEYCSVWPNAQTTTSFIGQITAVTATTITVSLSKFAGFSPPTGNLNTYCVVGGAWYGPTGASNFPFGFITNVCTSVPGAMPRVNFRNVATYPITAGLVHNLNGPIIFEGYTTNLDDGGMTQFDGTPAAAITPINIGGKHVELRGLIFSNSGATSGASPGISLNGGNNRVFRCVAHTIRASGLHNMAAYNVWEECEAYNCNTSNTSGAAAAFANGFMPVFIRCIAHHNTQPNASGFITNTLANTGACFVHCISHANGGHGFLSRDQTGSRFYGCDAYYNGLDGLRIVQNTAGGIDWIENCNFLRNGGYGIQRTDALSMAIIQNCGFGAGSMANVSGTMIAVHVADGCFNYPADKTPWVDPDDGDFRIVLPQAIGAARGQFKQTQAGYGDPNPTRSTMDMGAVQRGVNRLLPGGMTGGFHRT
jgi:hypothetical protein